MIADQKVIMSVPKVQRVAKNLPREKKPVETPKAPAPVKKEEAKITEEKKETK